MVTWFDGVHRAVLQLGSIRQLEWVAQLFYSAFATLQMLNERSFQEDRTSDFNDRQTNTKLRYYICSSVV